MKIKIFVFNVLFIAFFQSAINSQNINMTGDTIDLPSYTLESKDPFRGHINVISKNTAESVLLRWGTNNATAWHYAKQAGFNIIRTPLIEGKVDTAKSLKLTKEPIKPWSKEKFLNMAAENLLDSMTQVVGQMLYGEIDPVNLSELERADIFEMKFSYIHLCADLSRQAAEAAGLSFEDTKISENEMYLYQIYSEVDTNFYILDAGGQLVFRKQIYETINPKINKITSGDKSVVISWEKDFHSLYFTAYFIERSEGQSNQWIRLNNFPYLPVEEEERIFTQVLTEYSYRDSLPENDVIYQYRIIGINPYGELSSPSEQVIGFGVPNHRPPSATHLQAKEIKSCAITLQWKMPHEIYEDAEVPGDIAGFLVARSVNQDGPFQFLTESLLSSDIRSYDDTSAIPFIHNYYVLYTVNNRGKHSVSLPANGSLLDTIGPVRPIVLSGVVDSLGLVTLQWKLGNDIDLKGYFIYYTQYEGGLFNRISDYPVQDTIFEHKLTLKAFIKSAYYYIVAVDLVGNLSVPSEILKIIRPDTIPPVSPQITEIAALENAIVLTWSSSSSEDVEYHFIQRIAKNESEWKTIRKLKEWQDYNNFEDKALEPDQIYYYRIIAVDDSGMESTPSESRGMKVMWDQNKLKVPKLELVSNESSDYGVLKWENLEGSRYFIIYQIGSNGEIKKEIHFDKETRQYEISMSTIESRNQFILRANIGGKLTEFSNIVAIINLNK